MLRIGTEGVLCTVCTNRDHTGDGAVQLRVDGTLCVGHFSLDANLTMNVVVSEPRTNEAECDRNDAKLRDKVDQVGKTQEKGDGQFHERDKQSLEIAINRLDVFRKSRNDSGSMTAH